MPDHRVSKMIGINLTLVITSLPLSQHKPLQNINSQSFITFININYQFLLGNDWYLAQSHNENHEQQQELEGIILLSSLWHILSDCAVDGNFQRKKTP